jgi:anti-anti-sigma factor
LSPLEELDFESRGEVVLARLSGEVDLSNASSVRERVLDAVPNSATSLVLDLTETQHLDSSGVRLIFELAERLGIRNQKLELVVPDDSVVRRVLVLTEVPQVVAISSSLDSVLP